METDKTIGLVAKSIRYMEKVIAVSVRYWNAKEDYIKKISCGIKKN